MKLRIKAYFYMVVSYFFLFIEEMRCLAEMKPVRFNGEIILLLLILCCCLMCLIDYCCWVYFY